MREQGERFHAGERMAQQLAGFKAVAGAFHDSMPDQHRSFFAALPYIFASSIDGDGWPVATLFSGPPGFISSPDDRHLRIHAPRREDDPGQAVLRPGQQIGLLGIDFSNRRRNRANGRISRMDKNRMEIAVAQSFGNCPKYIQTRQLEALTRSGPLPAIENLTELDESANTLITRADTFFIASYAPGDSPNGGADISHRGGQPGFVRLEQDSLWIPDFAGNRYMNTLGNLLAQPRAALLFMDFERGDILHLQGTTDIVWRPDVHCPLGTERYWRVHIRNAWRFRSALPWRGQLLEYSPATLQTGVW